MEQKLSISIIHNTKFSNVITKTGNDHKPPQTISKRPQTITNDHKRPANDHKLPQITTKHKKTTTNFQQANINRSSQDFISRNSCFELFFSLWVSSLCKFQIVSCRKSETYSEPSQTFKMELFCKNKTVNYSWPGSEFASASN